MRKTAVAGACLVAALVARTVTASVVTPPPFETLVAEAGEIFVGKVTGQGPRWIDRGGKRLIVTDVTFQTEQVLKGSPGTARTLTFLGGIIGDARQEVVGMPTFVVGDRDVLFVRSGESSFLPVLGLFHGRFRVVAGRNGTGDFVANNARQPLLSTAAYANPARLRATDNPMRLQEFVDSIRRAAGGR